MAMRSETRLEVEFFEAAFDRYASAPVRRVLEPGCGGGRLLVEMARRGYHATGFDSSRAAVAYARRRVARLEIPPAIHAGDMTHFDVGAGHDAAFCTWNTFRHLLTEAAALSHLESMAAAVRSGGIYILGLHLMPPDADPESTERWTARHGATQVTYTLRVLDFDRRRRRERLRMSIRARTPRRDLRLRSEFEFRLYTARQMGSLLAKAPAWELCDVFDFWYDITEPLVLNDEMADTLLVLRRR